MRNQEFMYWLQGFFELHGPQSISITQADVIRNHLVLVEKVEGSLGEFQSWLDGFLSAVDVGQIVFDKALVARVRAQLDDIFEHAIDPKYPGDAEALQKVHDGADDVDEGGFPADDGSGPFPTPLAPFPIRPPRPSSGSSGGAVFRC